MSKIHKKSYYEKNTLNMFLSYLTVDYQYEIFITYNHNLDKWKCHIIQQFSFILVTLNLYHSEGDIWATFKNESN